MGTVQVELSKERETPGTFRYAEEDRQRGKLGTIYVPKSTLAELLPGGSTPEKIRVTIEAI